MEILLSRPMASVSGLYTISDHTSSCITSGSKWYINLFDRASCIDRKQRPLAIDYHAAVFACHITGLACPFVVRPSVCPSVGMPVFLSAPHGLLPGKPKGVKKFGVNVLHGGLNRWATQTVVSMMTTVRTRAIKILLKIVLAQQKHFIRSVAWETPSWVRKLQKAPSVSRAPLTALLQTAGGEAPTTPPHFGSSGLDFRPSDLVGPCLENFWIRH